MTTALHPDDVRWRLDALYTGLGGDDDRTARDELAARVTALEARLTAEGIDVEDPGFWRDGLAETRSRVDAYERLVAAAAAGRDGA